MKTFNTGKVRIGEYYLPPPPRIIFTSDDLLIQRALLGEVSNRSKKTKLAILVFICLMIFLKVFA
jgi:hypothetical protein